MSKYSRKELEGISYLDSPSRGLYCPKCKTYIPSFEELDENLESRVKLLIRNGSTNLAMAELKSFTGCNEMWAKIWVKHKGKPCAEYPGSPCPFCGKQLRTTLAKQCPHCLNDWHNEN